MTEYRLTEAGRIGLRMLLDAESLYRADRNGLHLLGMEDVVDLPDEWVEPAPPLLPAEPEPGAYLIGPFFAFRSDSDDKPWTVHAPGITEVGLDWPEVARVYVGERGQVRRLVPAPEPVTLPWRSPEHGNLAVKVDPSAPKAVQVMWGAYAHDFPPATARRWGHALLSAADQAEAVGRG